MIMRPHLLFITCIGLTNDHKTLMKTIEQQLYQLHAEAREKGMVSQPDTNQREKTQQINPFATVVSVIDSSPAADCVSARLTALFQISYPFDRVCVLVIE